MSSGQFECLLCGKPFEASQLIGSITNETWEESNLTKAFHCRGFDSFGYIGAARGGQGGHLPILTFRGRLALPTLLESYLNWFRTTFFNISIA